jgi:hypothetical protein
MAYRLIYSTIIIAMFLAAAVTTAQSIAVSVDSDSATVGDVITFGVALKVSGGARVVPPETNRGFGNFTVLAWDSETRLGTGGGYDTAVYHYSLSIFRPRDCTIPSLRFLVGGENDTVFDTLMTSPVPVRIISVIPEDTPDDALVIRDLKAQQRTGRANIRSLWILLLLALAVVAWLLWNKYGGKGAVSQTADVPLMPPYEEAVAAITELEGKGYLERGDVRAYAFELSEIFKRYIGRRYNTIAPELTTEEIVAWLEFSGISREMRLCAEWFFRTSDQVKFAKWTPDRLTVDRFMKEVRTFLEATKPGTELPYEQETQRMGVVE